MHCGGSEYGEGNAIHDDGSVLFGVTESLPGRIQTRQKEVVAFDESHLIRLALVSLTDPKVIRPRPV